MIKLFDQVLREHAPKHLTEGDFPLGYLKFSTVTSGSRMNDKVIFLVFKNGASLPSLCLKTVRNYVAKEVILQNFNNLGKLNTLTTGSPHARLFAQAIYLHDDGENVFSVETACPGKKVRLNAERLKAMVTDYISFQEYAAKQGDGSLRDMEQLTKEVVQNTGCTESDQQKLLRYVSKLPKANCRLPRIIQHGDLTPDNLLLCEDGLCIIDYDYVSGSDVPGFDLFGLFRRLPQADVLALCEQYFPAYFKVIGGECEGGEYRRLLFLCFVIAHTQKKTHLAQRVSPEEIIYDFERISS